MELHNLEVYHLAREIARDASVIYQAMDWEEKKVIGTQFIRAVDSIGANIAEGFGRFHYLDKNKFNYNARGSLLESIHWIETLQERNILSSAESEALIKKLNRLAVKLNNYIASTKSFTKKKGITRDKKLSGNSEEEIRL